MQVNDLGFVATILFVLVPINTSFPQKMGSISFLLL